MESKPIRRSDQLIALSRDHHTGLQFCWKIREGLKKETSSERLSKYAQYFWEAHLRQHFIEEEILLFNQIDSIQTQRAKEEHILLAELFGRINADGATELNFLELIGKLNDHIRYEEREVFSYLENALSAATLAGIGALLTRLHATAGKDDYPDEFWLNLKNN